MIKYNPKHYKKNKEYFNEYYKNYYKKHREEIKKRIKEYRERNKRFSYEERLGLADTFFGVKCELCGFEPCVEIHHIIPRSEGGTDNPDNLIAVCPNHHMLIHKYGYTTRELIEDPFPVLNKLKYKRERDPRRLFKISLNLQELEEAIPKDIDSQLELIGHCLGLFSERDKEKSCFRVFLEIVKTCKDNPLINSEEISERTHLSRAGVLFHLRRLREAKIVDAKGNYYMLNRGSLSNMIEEIRKNIIQLLIDMKKRSILLDQELSKLISKDDKIIILDK